MNQCSDIMGLNSSIISVSPNVHNYVLKRQFGGHLFLPLHTFGLYYRLLLFPIHIRK